MRFAEHPTWRMFVAVLALVFVMLILGIIVMRDMKREINTLRTTGREQDLINRGIACMDIINDGEITLTGECVDRAVAAYYPAGICILLPERVSGCGSKTEEI